MLDFLLWHLLLGLIIALLFAVILWDDPHGAKRSRRKAKLPRSPESGQGPPGTGDEFGEEP
ncbi:hypothetical protein [Caenibacillus caldisaponilyticus]|uniref:hypothetical protein n=1 Tax=Caenibacillus caldisaponilyticus TaxID=1674942 RepID=UPI0009886BF2|nr:hypothetical protein [Caenibacillus caldisaponilyticus]